MRLRADWSPVDWCGITQESNELALGDPEPSAGAGGFSVRRTADTAGGLEPSAASD